MDPNEFYQTTTELQENPQTGCNKIEAIKLIFKSHLDQIFELINNEETKLKFSSLKELCYYLLVMRGSLDGIINDKYFTKRELFYQNSNIFLKQETINEAIKQFSFNTQIPRRDLHIISASKGLVCGALILRQNEIQINLLELTAQGKGLNITEFMDQWEALVYGKYILVVEKETVYFHLINEMNQDFLMNTVMITGKGYPCYSTKRFVKYLSELNPLIPVYYFGDMDPHGYDILCQYAFGNKLTLHEQNNVPWIRWLNYYIPQDLVNIKKQMKITQRELQLLECLSFNPEVPEEWKTHMNKEFKYEIEDYECELSSMILRVLESQQIKI